MKYIVNLGFHMELNIIIKTVITATTSPLSDFFIGNHL